MHISSTKILTQAFIKYLVILDSRTGLYFPERGQQLTDLIEDFEVMMDIIACSPVVYFTNHGYGYGYRNFDLSKTRTCGDGSWVLTSKLYKNLLLNHYKLISNKWGINLHLEQLI
jgi:hypothetical protein